MSNHENITISQTGNSIFNFPNKKCTKISCVSLFLSESGDQVNITAIIFKSTNPHDIDCLYAGLVVGERLAHYYRESKTICEHYYSSNSQSGSFYSKNSSLILVMYWYKEYGEINASVMVSQTKCKPVVINLCYLNILCLRYRDKCQSYLENVTKFSGINLQVQKDDSVIYEGNFGKCSVLQVFSFPTVENKNWYCNQLINRLCTTIIKSCSLVLTSKQTLDIKTRLSTNGNDIIVIERQVELCKNTKLCLKHISEKTVPRMKLKRKKMEKIWLYYFEKCSIRIEFYISINNQLD